MTVKADYFMKMRKASLPMFLREKIDSNKIRILASKNLKKNDLAERAIEILNFALEAVDPERLIKRNLKRERSRLEIQGKGGSKVIDLDAFDQVFMISLGKAASSMARAFLEILSDRINKGIVVCPPQNDFSWPRMERLEAPHPFSDGRSLTVADKIISLSQEVGEKDLVFFLISGGASAQIAKPIKSIRLPQKVELVKALMASGADIRELNVVRKHLSEVKGGRLGKMFNKATLINIFISDVIDDDIETIASALTTWDSSTFMEAKEILQKYKLWDKCPQTIKEVIEKGIRGEIEETRKIDNINQEKHLNFIIGNIEVAVEAASKKAAEHKFIPIILTVREKGEARERARLWSALIKNLSSSSLVKFNSYALISGGELTVTVQGKGKGGRNMEFCLALLKELAEAPMPKNINWCATSLATDGRDGPTEAAGAIIFPQLFQKINDKKLDMDAYLGNNDSFTFFKKLGSLIMTGPTGTNVMDLRLFLIKFI